ncbi:hypothetical protein [Actinacidiphila guanduensis]|uniref:Lipoprotein n=1 Tax=Actinacidiphila guanduensis TaxID=310781 RepID=A0A1H0ACE3_9ACTN|nr:hypothetical protein [Actinacidiphila guanduensis]SDN31239.1 hypothetical protein SAMN05216259_103493 [Actinacidiphila guanduensis]
MGHARRATTAVTLVAAAAITLTACGGGGGGSDDKPSASSNTTVKASSGSKGGATPSATPTQVLAQMKGAQGITITINSAVRDSSGFVTVQGVLTNDSSDIYDANELRGNETALVASGASVAGAVLVDEAGKKRYYVLRDTDGRCLCTMGLEDIEPQASRPFFAQFPSPPPTTTSVEFELPTMPPAKISLSEG